MPQIIASTIEIRGISEHSHSIGRSILFEEDRENTSYILSIVVDFLASYVCFSHSKSNFQDVQGDPTGVFKGRFLVLQFVLPYFDESSSTFFFGTLERII